MSQHRRLNPTTRPPRRKRVPAYQVRHRPAVSHHSPRSAGQPNGHMPESSRQRRRTAGDTEAFEPVHDSGNELPYDRSADENADTTDDGVDELDDYAAYLKSVEEAAARSRTSELRAAASVAAATPEARAPVRAVAYQPSDRSRRATAGGGSPPRNRRRTRNGRPSREPDPRPLLRRPKTWIVIIAMLFAVSALIVVLYTLNLVKATYDAYNEMHVVPTPRPVFQVNPEGTAVAVPTEEVAATLPDWESGDAFNILLLGVDDRDGEDEPVRSDTMIVVRVDPTAKSVTMMSIPRDLQVYIPNFRTDKINAAYPLGEYYDVPGGGVSLAAQTIEANFDIRIHYFITVDFTGFRKIVDTIGGVIIDVQAPVKDDQYPTETYGLTRVYFPTGLQHLDGTEALRYVRTRHGDNDIARGNRQQQVLLAIRQQALNLGLITRAESLIRDTGDAVRTDLNFNQLLALANLGRQIESENIHRINLWEEGLIFEHWPDDEDDAFYFDADWNGIWWIAATYFKSAPASIEPSQSPTTSELTPTSTSTHSESTPIDETLLDFDIPIVIQNASNTDRIATSASEILLADGFSDVTPDDAILVREASAIYDSSGNPDTAAYIALLLGIDASRIYPSLEDGGIVVVLGEDYVLP